MQRILYFEGCNFADYPMGGTLSFAKQMICNVEAEFYLVGISDSRIPVGQWSMLTIQEKEYDFFSIGNIEDLEKSRLPKRIVLFRMLNKYIKEINKTFRDTDVVFTQTPQFVFLIAKYEWKKFCFCFAGLGNSVGNSRFKILRIFGGLYEKKLFRDLNKSCHLILAAADDKTISEKSTLHNLKSDRIKQFPTRFDDKVFYVKNQKECKSNLGYNNKDKLIVTVGRLAEIKGWRDLIDSFRLLTQIEPNSILIFIGDGEERSKIEEYAQPEIEDGKIVLTGKKTPMEICDFLNAADVFCMFSLLEGWPTAMVEALACGKNIVTTNVSGAKDMVHHGKNGFIIENRDIYSFSQSIIQSMELPNPNMKSIRISEKYSVKNLNNDFFELLQ